MHSGAVGLDGEGVLISSVGGRGKSTTVLGCLRDNTTKVRNIKKYLLAALFNAPSTMGGYFQAEVNHDRPEYAGRRMEV